MAIGRIGAWARPHCWVRTHVLMEDVLPHALVEECGGEGVELEQRERIAQNEDLHKKTNAVSRRILAEFLLGGARRG